MRISCRIQGRVQGVGFRVWTQQTAQTFNLSGWVKNDADGSVSALFDGEPTDVEAMLKECRRGPSRAQVTAVETPAPIEDFEPQTPFAILG